MEKCLSKSLLVVLTIFIFTIVITYNNNAGDLKGDVFKTESTNDDAETAKLIQDRVMRLEEWCSGKTEVKFIDFRSARDNLVSYDWMYVPEYRLFYCSIPKVASTTLKKRLMEVIGVTVANDTTEIHQQAVKYLSLNDWNNKTSMSDVPLARSRRNPFAPPVSRNRSLIVVRNPYERLVSAFQDKIVNAGGEWTHLRQYCYNYEPAMATTSTNNQVFAVTFSEFVNCVLSNHHSKQPFYNDHVCPMSKICATCLIRYDLISKFQRLSTLNNRTAGD